MLWVILISPFALVLLRFALGSLSIYFDSLDRERLNLRVEEYSHKYKVLGKPVKLLGISFPKGTEFTGWKISNFRKEVIFEEAILPRPIYYNGLYVNKMRFLDPSLKVHILDDAVVDGWLCQKNTTVELGKRRGADYLESCQIAHNPIKQHVNIIGFDTLLVKDDRRFRDNPNRRWVLTGAASIDDFNFDPFTVRLDKHLNILRLSGKVNLLEDIVIDGWICKKGMPMWTTIGRRNL